MEAYYEAATLMKEQGGSFVKALAECWFTADHVNKRKLEECFSDYFSRYSRLAIERHLRG